MTGVAADVQLAAWLEELKGLEAAYNNYPGDVPEAAAAEFGRRQTELCRAIAAARPMSLAGVIDKLRAHALLYEPEWQQSNIDAAIACLDDIARQLDASS